MTSFVSCKNKAGRSIFFPLLCCLLMSGSVCKAQWCDPADSTTLVEYYYCQGMQNTSINWLTGPVYTWNGVGLSGSDTSHLRYVVGLNISGWNLGGNLCTNICNLEHLGSFICAHNNFSGPLPECLGGLPLLQTLIIFDNAFSGPLPLSLGDTNSNKLNDISIWQNNFTGPFPDTIMKSKRLFRLFISENDFTAIHYFNNPKLIQVLLFDNQFTFNDVLPFVTSSTIVGISGIAASMDSVLSEIDTTIIVGNSIALDAWVDTCSNLYSWFKNGNMLNYHSPNPHWVINNAQTSHSGVYTCYINNAQYWPLTLHRRPINLHVVPAIGIEENLVFPNPCQITFSSQNNTLDIRLNIPDSQKLNSAIYDMTGRQILSLYDGSANNQSYQYNLNNLPSGIYIIKVCLEEQVFTAKIAVL
jgi:hypothetical protein